MLVQWSIKLEVEFWIKYPELGRALGLYNWSGRDPEWDQDQEILRPLVKKGSGLSCLNMNDGHTGVVLSTLFYAIEELTLRILERCAYWANVETM